MHDISRARGLAFTLMAVAMALGPALAASAHEARTVGPLDLEVGFGAEPAYAGQPNSVSLSISNHGTPVMNLKDSIKVEVSYGDQISEALTLEHTFGFEDGKLEFGEPGTYEAFFVPSQPGPYTFHLMGSYAGTKVHEAFTSSPTGIDEVQDPSSITFPPVVAPTNEELATRIEQESARTQDAVRATTAAADDAASSARTLGYVGIVLGALGIIVGATALLTRKR
jgi:hypothetical protein